MRSHCLGHINARFLSTLNPHSVTMGKVVEAEGNRHPPICVAIRKFHMQYRVLEWTSFAGRPIPNELLISDSAQTRQLSFIMRKNE